MQNENEKIKLRIDILRSNKKFYKRKFQKGEINIFEKQEIFLKIDKQIRELKEQIFEEEEFDDYEEY